MSLNLTAVDHQILTVLGVECARSQGYLVERTGRSRQQIRTRLQLLAGHDYLRYIHEPTAVYELVFDPRPPNNRPVVELNIIDEINNILGQEWLSVSDDGIPTSHRYTLFDTET